MANNPFRRSPRQFTASAIRVDLSNRNAVKKVLGYRKDWQKQAIEDIVAIGELQYGLSVPAALASRVNIFGATEPDEVDAEPTRTDNKLVIDTMDRLGSTITRTDLLYDLAFNLLGPGELYLICIAERGDQPEYWCARGIYEVEEKGTTVKVFDDRIQEDIILDQPGDTFIRVWRPDPFDHKYATSHVRAVLGVAEELLWWDAAAQAVAKSRLSMAGLIGVPSNLEVRAQSEEEAELSGTDRFIARFLDTAMRAQTAPSDQAASIPILFTYPANDQAKSGLEKIEFERPQDELLEARTDRAMKRIEQGINLPAGVISGVGNASHWGAGQIEMSVFRDHVEPLVLLICSALTRAFLVPALKGEIKLAEEDRDPAGLFPKDDDGPDKYFVWYDASNLIIHQDRAANGLRALELGAINYKALRRELGYSETDEPDEAERQEIIEWLQEVRGKGKEANVPLDENGNPKAPTTPPTKTGKPGQKPSESDHVPVVRGKGQAPIAASLNGSTELVASQLQVMCDEKCRRALERVGNKLRARAKKSPQYTAAINGIPAHRVASTLGREVVAKLAPDDIFSDEFAELHSRFVALLPVDFLAVDTIVPVQKLITELKLLCAKALFDPPRASLMVPMELITDTLLETLANQPMTA